MAKPHTSHRPYSLEYLRSLEKKEAEKLSNEKSEPIPDVTSLEQQNNNSNKSIIKKIDDERTM